VSGVPRYRCRTHGVELVVEEGRREIRAPFMVNCLLMNMREPREGKYGECEVVRVG
jgi:hypothetical protein